MPSWQARGIGLAIQLVMRRARWGDARTLVRRARRLFGAPNPLQWARTRGVRVRPVADGVVRGEWVGAEHDERGVILYLHGGGYVAGSAATHRPITAALARLARRRVFSLDYRLAPEHPFPAALEDAVAAYEWVLSRGIAPGQVVIAGDSAGGGLTVATLLALRERGLPRPAGGVCISPWVDLTNSAPSYTSKAAVDPIVTQEGIGLMTRAYIGTGDPKQPLVSPLYADLRSLPPLLIHVGSDEVLLDDAVGLAERARAAGVDVKLEEWPAMIHVWHWFLPMLDEAERAIAGIGVFVRARMA